MKIRDWILTIILQLALMVTSAANPGDTPWTRFYGNPSGEVTYTIKELPDGGYFITGSTNAFDNGFTVFYPVKINTDGDLS